MTVVCETLVWDSEFWGFHTARVIAKSLDDSSLLEVDEWCSAHAVKCLYFLAGFDDPTTTELAEDNGFRLVDMRVTVESKLDGSSYGGNSDRVRPWSSGDLETIEDIARTSHRDSRFHFDPNFPRERVDDLYATWIRNSCHGYADHVLVAEDGGSPRGYLTGSFDHQTREASIGLLGVASDWRGKGLGKELIRSLINWACDREARCISGVTQARNIEAMRFYQTNGFVAKSVELWYHRWA